MDYGNMQGGLIRMIERLKTEGTATKVPEIDTFNRANGNALLLGLLYDQRILAEVAFSGPFKLHERLGHLDMKKIAEMDPDSFRDVFGQMPAVHRFTNVMAERTQKLAKILSEKYDGDAAKIWNDMPDPATLEKRIKALPGFGPLKAKK